MNALAPLRPDPPSAPVVVGVIETLGQLSARELFVAGWTREVIAPGAAVMVMTATDAMAARWWAARADRLDVGVGAGFNGVLQLELPVSADKVLGVHLTATKVLRLYEHRQMLDAFGSTASLRQAIAGSQRSHDQPLLQAAAARYDGTDTIAGSALPIRLGIDDCVALGDQDILLSGWLFDPEHLAQLVSVSGITISDRWITRYRPDVLAHLAQDPRFVSAPAMALHCGFTALVPRPPSADLYLTIQTADQSLHMPLAPRIGHTLTLLSGIVRCLDPAMPSTLDVVDHLVAPILARSAPPSLRLSSAIRAGAVQADLAIVIGCSGDLADIGTVLATLATDPSTRDRPIIVAASTNEATANAGAVQRAACQFALQVTLVPGEEIRDHVDALILGAMAANAEIVCLLAADAVPQTPGWLAELHHAHTQAAIIAIPAQFDHATYGTQAHERERARRTPGADCCVVARKYLLAARARLGAYLDRHGKSRALLVDLASTLTPVTVPNTHVLIAAEPADLLFDRADRQAALLRQQKS